MRLNVAMMKKILIGVLIGLAALAAGGATGVVVMLRPYQTAFMPGVYISGVNVSGLEPVQAAETMTALPLADGAACEFYYADRTYALELSSLLSPEETLAQVENIWQQEQSHNLLKRAVRLVARRQMLYDLQPDYSGAAVSALVQTWHEDWDRPARNAQLAFSEQGFQVEPGEAGLSVDDAATLAQLPASWNALAGQRYAVVMQITQPQVTADDFAHMGEIASYSTKYNSGEINRTNNLRQAAAKINGHVMQADEEFSFNGVVGIRESSTGFQDAMVIVNGKYELGLGGGICQVSSTLYNAVLLSDLTITERHNHALAVAYVPVGRDATVVYGALDFRFRNTSGSPIYLAAQADSGTLSIAIFGDVSHKKAITITNIIDQVIPFQEVQELKPSLEPGATQVDHSGGNGYVARTYRNYLNAQGEVERSEFLAKDSYRPLNQLTYVGPPASGSPVDGDPDAGYDDDSTIPPDMPDSALLVPLPLVNPEELDGSDIQN
jgi:vancomycin resistance protein YoaR